MNASRRYLLYGVLLAVLAGAGAFTAWSQLDEARSEAQRAAGDAQRARVLAHQVLRLRERPAVAAEAERELQQLAAPIEAAADAALIARQQVLSIDPEPARRLGRSPLLEKPTTLRLSDVTLEGLTRFLHRLETQPEGDDGEAEGSGRLRSTAIRLSTPRGQEPRGLWNADVTLTYLIYSPQRPEGGARLAEEGP